MYSNHRPEDNPVALFMSGFQSGILDRIKIDRDEMERQQAMEERLKYEERRMLLQKKTQEEIDRAKGAAAELAYDDVVSQYGGSVRKTADFASSLGRMTSGQMSFLQGSPNAMLQPPMPRTGQDKTYMQAFEAARKSIYPSQNSIQQQVLEQQRQRNRIELEAMKQRGRAKTAGEKAKNVNLSKAQSENLYKKETTSVYSALAESPSFVTKAPVLMAHKPTLDMIARGLLDKMAKGQLSKGSGKTEITPMEQFARAAIESGFPSDDSSLEFLQTLWQKYTQAYARAK